MSSSSSFGKWCFSCKKFKNPYEFWDRRSDCKDCIRRREGSRTGLPKGDNVRVTLHVPKEVKRELDKLARERNVTLSKAVTDVLKGALL